MADIRALKFIGIVFAALTCSVISTAAVVVHAQASGSVSDIRVVGSDR
jgi:hypothetical protein